MFTAMLGPNFVFCWVSSQRARQNPRFLKIISASQVYRPPELRRHSSADTVLGQAQVRPPREVGRQR